MAGITYRIPMVGIVAACAALGVSRATFCPTQASPKPRPHLPRPLNDAERLEVLAMVDGDRFADIAPPKACAKILEEERYLFSIRSMYRVLAATKSWARSPRKEAEHGPG